MKFSGIPILSVVHCLSVLVTRVGAWISIVDSLCSVVSFVSLGIVIYHAILLMRFCAWICISSFRVVVFVRLFAVILCVCSAISLFCSSMLCSFLF
jgi:hypothetical protein